MKYRVNKKLLLVGLLLLLSLGYALLSGNLTINGNSKLANSTWDIHFDNVVPKEGRVSIGDNESEAVINPNDNTEVTYNITLSKPGDFYEFNVDIVNAGSIDGQVERINSSLKIGDDDAFVINSDSSNLPPYLNYSITYSDDTEIIPNHLLKSGNSETIKVRIEFKRDIDSSILPGDDIDITLTIQPDLIQESRISNEQPNLNSIYRFGEDEVYLGESIEATTEEAFCAIHEQFGNSCDFGMSWETEPECNDYLSSNNIDAVCESSELNVIETEKYCIPVETDAGTQYDCFNSEEQCQLFLNPNGSDTCETQTETKPVYDYTTDYSTIDNEFFLKHNIVNNRINSTEVCFKSNDSLECLKSGMGNAVYDEENNFYYSEYFNDNRTLLNELFGANNCLDENGQITCSNSNISALVRNDGHVAVYDEENVCLSSASSYCTYNDDYKKLLSAKVIVENGTVDKERALSYEDDDVTFNLTPDAGMTDYDITCTNNQTASIQNDVLTIKKISNNTVCTVTYGQYDKYQVTYNPNGGHNGTIEFNSNDTDYPWIDNNGIYKSGNYHVNSTTSALSSKEFTLTENDTLSFEWAVSSQDHYNGPYHIYDDLLYYTIYKDGRQLSGTGYTVNGNGEGGSSTLGGNSDISSEDDLVFTKVTKELEPGKYSIVFSYYKNYSTHSGLDSAYVKNISLEKKDFGLMSNSTHKVGQPAPLNKNIYTKDGYDFLGWSKNQNATEATYQDKQNVMNLSTTDGDVVDLYAIWEATGYVVNVVVNNGVVNGQASKKVYDGNNAIFSLSPNDNSLKPIVSCTNNQHGTVTNNELTVENVTASTTCTVRYCEANTVLFEDGTLVVNEEPSHRTSNIESHGQVSYEYEPYSNSNQYIFKQSGAIVQLWRNKNDEIKNVVVDKVIQPTDTSYWFYELNNMELGDFTNLDTSQVIAMESMFKMSFVSSPQSFRLIGLDDWDTTNVENMNAMFIYTGYNSETWEIGDISGWNTSNVTDMSYMFDGAGRTATTFNIGNLSLWNTSNVTDMSYMFSAAGARAKTWNIGNISGWNTLKVTNMSNMFWSTAEATTTFDIGNLSNWKTINVTDMSFMFFHAGESATTYNIGDLSSWNTSNVTNMMNMFSGAGYNTTVFDIGDLSGWNTSKVENMSNMFRDAGYNSTTFNIGNIGLWDTSQVTNMAVMFAGAGYNATTWNIGDLSNWNVSKVEDMSQLFDCAGYHATTWSIGVLNSWDTSKVTDMDNLFVDAGHNATTWNSIGTLKVYATNIEKIFSECPKAKATLNIYSNPTLYDFAFRNTAKASDALITVNYSSTTTNIDYIIGTKYTNSNVVKGVRLD